MVCARVLSALALAAFLLACGDSGAGSGDAGKVQDTAVDVLRGFDLLAEVSALEAGQIDSLELHAQDVDAALCVPNCHDKQCGHDGCRGSCGSCPCQECAAGMTQCLDSVCVVPPTCFDIFLCLENCADTAQECQIVCLQQAPHEEQVKFDAYYDCFLQGKLPLPDDCFAQHCPQWANTDFCNGTELLECISPGENECEEAAFACFAPQQWL